MSQEIVELVRRTYLSGAFDRSGLEPLMAPDFEFVNPADAIEPGVRRGPEELAAISRSVADAFDAHEHHLARLFDAGESVVAEVTFHARGGASGAELEQYEVHTWTFRDGKVVRFEWGRDLASALKAVGLEES
jgi:ketosteroid isomerase-like protein